MVLKLSNKEIPNATKHSNKHLQNTPPPSSLVSKPLRKTSTFAKTLDEVYADSAYANKQNDKKLGKQNNKVLHRAYRNKPLTKQQKQDNKQRSSIRYIVERTFGLLKLHHGLGKARHLGIERNKWLKGF